MNNQHPCETNPELWVSTNPADQAKAVAGCHRCPDMEACRVLGEGEIRGVWGGVVRGRTSYRPTCAADGCGNPVRGASRRYCSARCRRRAERARRNAREQAREQPT